MQGQHVTVGNPMISSAPPKLLTLSPTSNGPTTILNHRTPTNTGHVLDSTPNRSVVERFDDSFLNTRQQRLAGPRQRKRSRIELCFRQPQSRSTSGLDPSAKQGEFATTVQQNKRRSSARVLSSEQALLVRRQPTACASLPPGETRYGEASCFGVSLDIFSGCSSKR